VCSKNCAPALRHVPVVLRWDNLHPAHAHGPCVLACCQSNAEGLPGQLDASPAGRPLGLSYAEGCDPSTPTAAAAWAPARTAPVAVRLPAAVPAITIPSKAFEQGAEMRACQTRCAQSCSMPAASLQCSGGSALQRWANWCVEAQVVQKCGAMPVRPIQYAVHGRAWAATWRHSCALRQSCSASQSQLSSRQPAGCHERWGRRPSPTTAAGADVHRRAAAPGLPAKPEAAKRPPGKEGENAEDAPPPPPPDTRSWLQKNWIFAVPVVMIVRAPSTDLLGG